MRRLLLLLTLLVLVGCQQHRFMTEADFQHYQNSALTPRDDSNCADDLCGALDIPPPATVVSPEGKRREITLAECIAVALENGRVGDADPAGDLRRALARRVITAGRLSPSDSTDAIRVFSYDPAVVALAIEQSLAKFDAQWQTSMVWNRTDQPRSSQAAFFRANTLQREQAQFNTELLKPLPTGGLAGITFRTDYDFSSINQSLISQGSDVPNPGYVPVLEFTFEQPLLQGFGGLINQLRQRHPNGVRNSVAPGQANADGILLTRISSDQVQLEYEALVQTMLCQVEAAYWELHWAYWDYYSRETAMRQAHFAWQIGRLRLDSGTITGQELAQIAQQFHLFRAQRLISLGNGQGLGVGRGRPGVLEAERRLRYLVGLPLEDGCRLIPVDKPIVAPFVPDWTSSLHQALRRRTELIQIRLDVQANQLAILREKDFLLPDLRFISSYNINAIGDHLDGRDANSALRNLSENEFNDWLLGFRFSMPIGFREAHAEVRRAQLQLAQRIAWLRDSEMKVAYGLEAAYRSLFQSYEEIRAQRARRIEATTQLDLQYQQFIAGKATIDVLLEAQRNWADALRDEGFAICDYNVALATFERQKGTILDYYNVSILDGPLPECAEARASAHIRERARSIILKQPLEGVPGVLEVPLGGETLLAPDAATVEPGISVPALLEQKKALPPIEELHMPTPGVKPMPRSLQQLRDMPLRDLSGGTVSPASHETHGQPLRPIRPPETPPQTTKPLFSPFAPAPAPVPSVSPPVKAGEAPVLDLIPKEPTVKPASAPGQRPTSSNGTGPARASVSAPWDQRPDQLGRPDQ